MVLTPTFEQVYAELEQEHRELMALVERIHGFRTTVGLVPVLEELHTLLIRHFSREQFPGGLYECMGAYGSRHHDELKDLVRDHCVILSAVRGLLEQVRTAGPREEPVLLGTVSDVLAQLHDHEQREHALADKLRGRNE
jgi:hypothetical protein